MRQYFKGKNCIIALWGENMITVYIDVLFMVNFLINILIIEGSGVITGEDTTPKRTITSSAVGALCAVLMFFPNFEFVLSMGMKLVLSCVMVLCAYKIKSWRHFLKMTGSFYIASFVFAGGIIAIMTTTGLGAKTGAVYSNGTVYFNLPWQVALLCCAGVYFLIFAIGRMRRKRITKKAAERNLRIYVQGQTFDIKAIIDTGNSLSDPITGDPVIVCEYDQMKKLIPQKQSLIDAIKEAGLRIRLVPFTSVGKESGIMPGFCPDRVQVDERDVKRCVVGISETRLFKNEDYHALLSPDLIIN